MYTERGSAVARFDSRNPHFCTLLRTFVTFAHFRPACFRAGFLVIPGHSWLPEGFPEVSQGVPGVPRVAGCTRTGCTGGVQQGRRVYQGRVQQGRVVHWAGLIHPRKRRNPGYTPAEEEESWLFRDCGKCAKAGFLAVCRRVRAQSHHSGHSGHSGDS